MGYSYYVDGLLVTTVSPATALNCNKQMLFKEKFKRWKRSNRIRQQRTSTTKKICIKRAFSLVTHASVSERASDLVNCGQISRSFSTQKTLLKWFACYACSAAGKKDKRDLRQKPAIQAGLQYLRAPCTAIGTKSDTIWGDIPAFTPSQSWYAV